MSVRARSAAVALLAIAVLVLLPGIAFAHAERSVGPFDLEIGFLGEPAYVGVPNAVFIELSKGGEPVTDLGDALAVTVGFGDQTSDPFLFEPLEEPGQFQAPASSRPRPGRIRSRFPARSRASSSISR